MRASSSPLATMDPLDALQPPAQLQMMFADMGFERRHHRTEPDLDVVVRDVVDVLDARGDVSKKPLVSENFALLSMFQSVLKCSLYARSSRSISFWYLSIENGGGANGESPLLGREARVHRLHHVVNFDRAAAGVVEVAADRREEFGHRAADALRERAALDAAPRAPGVGAQGLETDDFEQFAGLLGENGPQRGESLHPALEEIPVLA